jgi:hypothetical protein
MSFFYTTVHPCQHCKSDKTERVPRPAWMKVMPHLMRMRCSDCGLHFSARVETPRRLIEL